MLFLQFRLTWWTVQSYDFIWYAQHILKLNATRKDAFSRLGFAAKVS